MWSSRCSPQWTGPSFRTLKPPLLELEDRRRTGSGAEAVSAVAAPAAGGEALLTGALGYEADVAGASGRKKELEDIVASRGYVMVQSADALCYVCVEGFANESNAEV